jgi:hypothetical protein
MPRQNLVYNPSFRLGTPEVIGLVTYNRPLGWAAIGGATLDIATTSQISDAYYGSEYLVVNKSSLPSSGIETDVRIPTSAGLSYAASAYVRVPVTSPAQQTAELTLKIRWLDEYYEYLSETFSDLSTASIAPNQDWTRLSAIGDAPTGALYAEIYIYQIVPGSAGKLFHVDAILMEQADYVGGYLDNLTQGEEDIYVNRALTPRQPSTIGGMELNADITIGELVLNTIDEYGVVWVCTDIEGWWGQADPEIPDIPRGVEDGSYDVIGRYQSRQLTISGVFLPQNPAQVQRARDQLISATNLVRTGAWLRANEDPASPFPTRAAYVRLAGRPQIQTINARGRTEFTVPLKAADPVKYGWNDADNQGLVYYNIAGDTGTGTVTNYGTSDVTAVFQVTGPAGIGSTIYNALTDETITLVAPLRGSGAIGNVTHVEIFGDVATLTTEEDHQLLVGDIVTVSGVGSPYDTVGVTATVTASYRTEPFTFSFALTEDDEAKRVANGAVYLVNNDVLIVDTYSRSVTYNGDNTGQRSKVDTLTDWIKLGPGTNSITFVDSIDANNVIYKSFDPDTALARLEFESSHFMIPGQTASVALAESASLVAKSLTGDEVTLTTPAGHGFSVGDVINVQTTEISNITNKTLGTNVVTLTTAVDGGFAPGDEIDVAMTTVKNILSKSSSANTVTLKTADAHGFSTGDAVTVALPTSSTVSGKALSANLATLSTSSAHNYSIGDSVAVTMPTTTTIINKVTSGSSVILTTSAAHYFSVGDKIAVALPSSSVVTGTRSFTGANSIAISTAEADATTCYLTVSTGHGVQAGDQIMVTGVGARYNGVFTVASVGTLSITYAFAGTVEASALTTGVAVNTTRGYQVTLSTTAAHNFSTGDVITVGIDILSTAIITNRAATTTECTLTTSATHNFSVGETITVSGITGTRYNGTHVITAVNSGAKTIKYVFAGDAETSTASSGSIVNNMIASGYNGTKVIETIPSSTSLTYYYYGQDAATSSTLLGTTSTIVNNTNTSINGTVTITSTPSATQFGYTKVA